MKLASISVKSRPPIREFSVSNLADTVVIAGPNGVGKTSLLNQLLATFRNPRKYPDTELAIDATSDEEIQLWEGRSRLVTSNEQEAALLIKFLQRPKKRGQLKSGVLHFDATRVFENIQPYTFSWDFNDPFLEDMGWDYTFNSARDRFQDVVHALYRKIRSQKEEIAAQALEMQRSGLTTMQLAFPDPIAKFKEMFARLLPGKHFCALEERRQELRYTTQGKELNFTTLSSGEREVVTVLFDFLLRAPQDSVIIFDEPELHLHPELSYRLVRALRDAGERNQFIFCTHSADIISASLDQSVVFVGPPSEERNNQAVVVNEEHESAKILHLLGQSVGVISLGRRIVLVEGEDASLDKQTYGAILRNTANDLVLVPTGGQSTITAFLSAVDTVLNRTIWGVEFFMLCDGDTTVGRNRDDAKGRLKRLPRYHIENYFLDENILSLVLATMGERDAEVLDPAAIRTRLIELARHRISYAVALRASAEIRSHAGNIDIMPRKCHELDLPSLTAAFHSAAQAEQERVLKAVDSQYIAGVIRAEFERVSESFANSKDEWKHLIPGKALLKQFAQKLHLDVSRLKTVFIREASNAKIDPFTEVRSIFEHFTTYGNSG